VLDLFYELVPKTRVSDVVFDAVYDLTRSARVAQRRR